MTVAFFSRACRGVDVLGGSPYSACFAWGVRQLNRLSLAAEQRLGPLGRSILVVSEHARVHGKVKAGHVIIAGVVHGPLHATDLLELQPKARVVGDVRYELLEMHQGAQVEGELKPLKSTEKPSLKLAASNNA